MQALGSLLRIVSEMFLQPIAGACNNPSMGGEFMFIVHIVHAMNNGFMTRHFLNLSAVSQEVSKQII